MPKRSSKRRMDLNLLGKALVDDATGQSESPSEDIIAKAQREGKNIAAVVLGQRGGLKGGKARAEKLSSGQRSSIARKAAKARWNKGRE